MDYILNWIDKYGPIITKDTSYINDLLDWKRTVENDLDNYVKNVADEYIANYDWSQVPEFDVKADKVENAVLGHLASLDANGNLVDSGSGIDELIEEGNMYLATCNAVYVALQGKADSVHTHDGIKDVVEGAQYAKLYADNHNQGDPAIIIALADNNTPGHSVTKSVDIDINNIDNLTRALETPDTTPTSDSDKLITSGAVYGALQEKADSIHTHDSIINTDTEIGTSRIRCIADEETGVKIKFYIEPNGRERLDAEINKDNIDNLNRALTTPSSRPEDDATKLITSKAVYDALSDIFPMGIYTVNYSSVSSGNASISIANSTTVGTYNSFVAFISDKSGSIVSIFLTKASPSELSCLATLVIGDEEEDPITGNSYWACKFMIGNMVYECNVQEDPDVTYSVFELQS